MYSKSIQCKANEAAYGDGVRCRYKGLAVGAKYDYAAMRRLFERGFRAFARGIDRDEAYEAWEQGWHDEDDRIMARAQGVHPCGRPV